MDPAIITTSGMNILFLSSYPPRKCGIATFTQDLLRSIDNNPVSGMKSGIIAVNDNGQLYDYSGRVMLQIDENNPESFREAARKINAMNDINAVSIQHEFKLFGSDHGENLLEFVNELKKPLTTTFHTVLPYPSEERKSIVRDISDHSKKIVVMANRGKEILTDHYNIDHYKIEVIPHGIHDVPIEKKEEKEKLGYKDRMIISSFGFMRTGRGIRSSGKGYEYVLDAMPKIIEKFPNVLYLIIGVTHPKYLKTEGESYRFYLEGMARGLGIEKNVKFINQYLSLEDLFSHLKATDVYICPPLNPHQITSGTLAYAMGCGCPIVSTPFEHAKEMVTPERGILLEGFRKPDQISEAITSILSNPEMKENMGRKAYEFTRGMTWPKVADSYLKLFDG